MDTEKDKNVSCFTLDGVVAEMVIEVEDNQKTGFDDYKDLSSPIKGIDSSKEDVSEVKINDIEAASENVFIEKREDKENIVDVSKTSYMKDKNECEKSVKKERKRKFEENLCQDEEEKFLDHPRYPGRKRQANKRYISDDMVTSIIDSPDNVQTKEILKGEKRRKLDTDFNDVNKVSSPKKSDKNSSEKSAAIETIKKEKDDPSLKDKCSGIVKTECIEMFNETLDTEEPKGKILRKLPFRKNKNAPDVPDLKPKVFWLNGEGEGTGVKLNDIPEVRKRIKTVKSVRPLYKVLFYQCPGNGKHLVSRVLNFNGFPFGKESFEFTKRHTLLKTMVDPVLCSICDMLGVEKGSKATMIDNILNFLLKPYGKIDPSLDPSLQPVVFLERIELDHKFFQYYEASAATNKGSERLKTNIATKDKKNSYKSPPATSVRTTRNSMLKLKTDETSRIKSVGKGKDDSKHSTVKTKSSTREKDTQEVRSATKKNSVLLKEDKSKIAGRVKSFDGTQKFGIKNYGATKVKRVTRWKSKIKKSKFSSKNKGTTRKSVNNSLKVKASTPDKRMEIAVEPSVVKENKMAEDVVNESSVTEECETNTSDEELDSTTKGVSKVLSDSSETESSEETKFAISQLVPKSPMKTSQRRRGKPLKMFPKISESIQKANFSALQRLHILLFGASDKPDNLKGNILAFGGFPFLEGSEDWKQKHFLLSLLAQSNLREYLKLLCIEFSDDDQPTMINKLMQFLAAPTEKAIESKSPESGREIASPDMNNKEFEVQPKKSKFETKKNAKKKDKKPGRRRKVLMSEEEVRRLEASFAREQRALARVSRVPVPIMPKSDPPVHAQPQVVKKKPPTSDPHQLNALLQTVYKRRALKAAGAVISTPNKGEKVKLGDIENVKFLIVTSNLQDLEVLHQLIYMMPASKPRLRKNILDFDGFGFNEDSEKYKERMDLLNSLGYGVSKRLSFLLGLCPLHTDIPQQDLNELVMYFLMSPCKSKQVVPITQMPVDPTGLPEEGHVILKPSLEVDKISVSQSKFSTASETSPQSKVRGTSIKPSISSSGIRQKAKKSFNSGLKIAPVKKVLLPPAVASNNRKVLNFNPKQSVGSIPKSVAVLNPVQAIPTFSIPKASSLNTGTGMSLLNNPGNVAIVNSLKSPNANTLMKVPVVNPVSKMQILNSATKTAVLDAATKIPVNKLSHIPGPIIQNPLLLSSVSNKLNLIPKQNVMPAPILPGSKMVVRSPSVVSSPQEFLIQQKTPDGQQKTFKLIRLLPNHPLATAVKSPMQQATQVQQPVIITGAPLSGSTLPPGIVVMKNNSMIQLPGQNMQNVLPTVPLKVNLPIRPSSSVMTTSISNSDEFVLPDQGESATTSENDPDVEILNPLEDNPPTDNELYSSIQEIILSSNFEDITLRNVIERVSAQFPHHDLTHRHNFMKDCVKKIIIGT